MVIQRVTIQNTNTILPSTFFTSTELASTIRAYGGSEFYIIKPDYFTPCLTLEKTTGKVVVSATPIAKTRRVFDTKVTPGRAKNLPPNYIFHLNLDGKVLGIRRPNFDGLPLARTRQIVNQTNLVMAPLAHLETRIAFAGLLLKCLLDEDATPWEGTLRTGFFIGDAPLRHTNKIILPGVVAIAIPLDHGVRIKGIFKHAPDYSETVFWFELKRCVPTIFEILKETELSSRFMENLDKCL